MALKYFRMSEKGGITRPTVPAIITYLILIPFEAFFLRNSPFIAVFIVWPITWIIVSTLLSSPVRIVIAKVMHYTRENRLYSMINKERYNVWLEINKKTFKKTCVKIYEGESTTSND